MSDSDWKRMLLEPLPREVDPVRDAVDPAARHDRRRRSDRLRDRGGRVRINLTPMIDVTFLLLIFFVCTTQGLDAESIFRVDIAPMEARTEHGEPDPAAALVVREPPLRVRVAMGENGAIVSLEPRFAEVDSIASLERVMRQARRGGGAQPSSTPTPGAATGLFSADHPILLDPDPACPWNETVSAFNALLRAGYHHVGFAGALDAPTTNAPSTAAPSTTGAMP